MDDCLFLKLPGELRNQIYDYVFSDIKTRYKIDYWGCISGKVITSALLFTCRQIHSETVNSPYIYANSMFSTDSEDDLKSWISKLSESQRKTVTSVELRFGSTRDNKDGWWLRVRDGDESTLAFENLPGLKRIHILREAPTGPNDTGFGPSRLSLMTAGFQRSNPNVEVTSECEISRSRVPYVYWLKYNTPQSGAQDRNSWGSYTWDSPFE